MTERIENVITRSIHLSYLLQESFLENTVQFNVIEVSSKDNLAFIDNLDFKGSKFSIGPETEISIHPDEPIIKLHFSLEASFGFQPLHHLPFRAQVPENHCNLFYLPSAQGKEFYKPEPSKAFELFIKPEGLKRLLGEEFKRVLKGLDEAISNKTTYLHWDKSRFIPPHIRNKIMEILLCPYQGVIKKTYLENCLSVLLIDFFLAKESSQVQERRVKVPNADYLSLVNVETYIRQNLGSALRISELAEIAGFNVTKLKRDFKKVYGITIFKYITSLRMERAIQLITEDNMSIAQASFEVGFSHPQHFTTAFKRTMGYLPSQLKPLE